MIKFWQNFENKFTKYAMHLGNLYIRTNNYMVIYIVCTRLKFTWMRTDLITERILSLIPLVPRFKLFNDRILYVSTKKQIADLVWTLSFKTGAYYSVYRWYPGTFTFLTDFRKVAMPKPLASQKYVWFIPKMPTLAICFNLDNLITSAVQDLLRFQVPVMGVADTVSDPRVFFTLIGNDETRVNVYCYQKLFSHLLNQKSRSYVNAY